MSVVDICIFKITAGVELSMASTPSEYSVGTVVVKRCKCALADNVACNCWMLLSQTDESDIESPAQEWFNAHGKTAEISKVCSWRRCKLKFCFRDKFNIVTTWIPGNSKRVDVDDT